MAENRDLYRWYVYVRLTNSDRADCPIGWESDRYVVYGPNNKPKSLAFGQIGSAMRAATRQCGKTIVSFEVQRDHECSFGDDEPAEPLNGCPGDVGARDSF